MDQDQHIREIQREYLDFLDDEVKSKNKIQNYKKILSKMVNILGRSGNLCCPCEGNDQWEIKKVNCEYKWFEEQESRQSPRTLEQRFRWAACIWTSAQGICLFSSTKLWQDLWRFLHWIRRMLRKPPCNTAFPNFQVGFYLYFFKDFFLISKLIYFLWIVNI